jgi:hypothetical protein
MLRAPVRGAAAQRGEESGSASSEPKQAYKVKQKQKMEFIPIPQEVVEKTVKTTKVRIIRQILGKLKHKEDSRKAKILRRTCVRMSQYVMDNGKFSADEVDSLIDDMHRSILSLQKRKQKLQRYKKRRK